MIIETLEYPALSSRKFNLLIEDPSQGNNFDRTSFVLIGDVCIRVDWCDYKSDIDINLATLHIADRNLLLIGARFFWAIINLKTMSVNRLEKCEEFWSFSKYPESILVIKELEAESLYLDGRSLDKVPIDPPWESKEFENYIEFDSPVFGKKKLKLK